MAGFCTVKGQHEGPTATHNRVKIPRGPYPFFYIHDNLLPRSQRHPAHLCSATVLKFNNP